MFSTTPSATRHLPPEPMIGGLLRLLSESMRSHILRRVATFGYTDIVPAHLAVFQFPSPDGATPSELAGRAFMTKQAMNYLLGELEERGYLQRLPAEGDGRSRVVVLSRRGHRLVHAMRRAVTEVEVEWGRFLGKARFAQMLDALMDLYRSDLHLEKAS